MGKVIRIEDDSIRSMRKTLDDLPDKRLGKTRDEATEMLFEHLKKAMEKGYSFKELADILEKGNVSIPVATLRKKLAEVRSETQKEPQRRLSKDKQQTAATRKTKFPPETKREEKKNVPAYFTPDKPDSEL